MVVVVVVVVLPIMMPIFCTDTDTFTPILLPILLMRDADGRFLQAGWLPLLQACDAIAACSSL